MTDAKSVLWLVIGGVVGLFVLLGLVAAPGAGWRGLAAAGALLFSVVACFVVKATIVRDDIDVPDERPRARERELE